MRGLLLLTLLGCENKISTTLDDTGSTDGGSDDGGSVEAAPLDVEILSPDSGQWYLEGDAITVLVQVSDPAGGELEGLSLSWSGAALLDVEPAASTDAEGLATFELSPTLPVQLHSLSVLAERVDDGAYGLASVAFEVVDPDKDLDGYLDATYGGDDCDDSDPTINPAGEEYCDERDNDCDGEIDEEDAADIEIWYEDLDGDYYGKEDVVEIACDQPKDFVLASGDCDDTDDSIHPGAAEVCDEVDNDCDGLVDDDDPGLATSSGTPYYPDADEDSWGDYSEYLLACVAPDGWTDQPGDCDDADPDINPDAPEYCDGIDNNCLYGVDEDSAVDALAWYVDEDYDGYGVDDGDVIYACDQPTGGADELGDCDDADPDVNPGAVEVCNDGADTNCDGEWTGCQADLLDGSAVVLGENSLDEAGYAVANMGDLDGDGWDDLVVGARSYDTDLTDAGAVYLLLGPLSGELGLHEAETVVQGTAESGRAGRSVSGGLDADGDDVADLLVAEPNLSDGSNGGGGVSLFSGDALLDGGEQSLGDAVHRWLGSDSWGYLGVGLQLADVDGDGSGDALLGGTGIDDNGTNSGAVALYMGPFSDGETETGDDSWEAWIVGETAGDQVGGAIEATGDLDGDGVADLVLGASKSSVSTSDGGAVFLVSGMPSGSFDLADADARVDGEAEGDGLGTFVRAIGDIDGDGRDDLLTGAPGNDGTELSAGAAYLLAGSGDLADLDGAVADLAWLTVYGASTGDQLGTDGDGSGDHDGDGSSDLALGTPYEDGGSVLLFLGPLASGSLDASVPDAAWLGDSTTDGVGRLVRYAGSLAGTDGDSIVVGARGADVAGTDAGGLLLIGESGL